MNKTVLVVDDEVNIVTSLEYVIKEAGFDVVTAYDGEEALAKVAEFVPDLVILDVMMPKLDGFEVCQKIRENPQWKSMFIVMLTAKGRDTEREKGLSLGANDYLTKPFSTHDIVKRVKSLLSDNKEQ